MSSVSGQFLTFLQFAYCGAAIGFLHFLTHPLPFGSKIIKCVFDVLFSVLMLVTVLIADYAFGNGEIKTFSALGIVAGLYIYYKFFKNPLDRLSFFVYNKIIKDLSGRGGDEKNNDK